MLRSAVRGHYRRRAPAAGSQQPEAAVPPDQPKDATSIEGEDEEAAALAALCGSVGLEKLREEGSTTEALDWRERIRDRRLRAGQAPMITEAKPMDVDIQRLTEQAWELRGHGDRCVAKDAAQAVRYYEWAMDVLRPVPMEHAGPSRCALLMKLAGCHLLQNDRRFPADPARCLQYLEQVKENDVNCSWQAESKKLREEALALGGQPSAQGAAKVDGSKRQETAARVAAARGPAARPTGPSRTTYCLELNSVQTFNMLDTVLTDDLFFAMDAIKQDQLRRSR
ncbi:unnamed protein product [Symbiodinium sp. CCMP2456]|nr:unnamed protein product [Symbiodinium sp. CCMP2456]